MNKVLLKLSLKEGVMNRNAFSRLIFYSIVSIMIALGFVMTSCNNGRNDHNAENNVTIKNKTKGKRIKR